MNTYRKCCPICNLIGDVEEMREGVDGEMLLYVCCVNCQEKYRQTIRHVNRPITTNDVRMT